MNNIKSLYPDYDVLELIDEWDSHTKEIVKKRLGPFQDCTNLSAREQQMIETIARHIAYEDRNEILDWIVFNVDELVSDSIGETQRKPETFPRKKLVQEGLKALNKWAKQNFKKSFLELDQKYQFQILSALQLGQLPDNNRWDASMQKDLFTKLVGMVIDAYYSHPRVWSEIGYGGPAYPRGYVRVELGLTDPWEPK